MSNLIIEVETSFGTVTVVKVQTFHGNHYDVRVNGVDMHPGCDAESAMRALAHYLQAEGYRLQKAQK